MASALSRRFAKFGKNCFSSPACVVSQPHFVSTAAIPDAEKCVETQQLGNVFVVAINRPTVRNCVNKETAAQLVDAFTHFNENDDLKTAVLHGKGGCFCSGYDLKALADSQSLKDLAPIQENKKAHMFRPMGLSGVELQKPVIAAISGYAVAGGLELALSCDLRIVEESAIMGVFCRRFGVPLIDGGTVRLTRLIGLSRAMDMILTGRPVNAAEALQFGLANKVVINGTAVGEAIKLAQRLCGFPQACMLTDRKSALFAAYDADSFDQAMQYEFDHGSQVIETESVAGAKSFTSGSGRHGKFEFGKKSKL